MTSSHGSSWWRHQMEIFSALLAICAENSPVPGEFPAQRPVMRSFDVFFDLRPNKRLSKQSWGWWSETPSSSLWRHRNVFFRGTAWPFVRGIHRSPVNSPHKGPVIRTLLFRWCGSASTVKQTVKWPVIWDYMTFKCRHCNGSNGWMGWLKSCWIICFLTTFMAPITSFKLDQGYLGRSHGILIVEV